MRVGAFMGYRIIADLLGMPVAPAGAGRVALRDERFGGYLANIPPSLWESQLRARLPETMGGAEFLARYGGTTDAVTQVDPARSYAVRQPTAHPIYEHHRVRLFRALLESVGLPQRTQSSPAHAPSEVSVASVAEETFALLGELMFQSHASYSACGLGSDGTDQLVNLVRAAGPAAGLFGAKITGGGSGGTVAVLARRGSESTVRALAASYASASGRDATILGGSSPGAAQLGALELAWDLRHGG